MKPFSSINLIDFQESLDSFLGLYSFLKWPMRGGALRDDSNSGGESHCKI